MGETADSSAALRNDKQSALRNDKQSGLRNDKHNGRRMTENKSLVGIGLVAEDFFAAALGDEEGFAGQVGDWGA